MSPAPDEWSASTPQPHRPTATRIPVAEADLPALENVEVTVRFTWSDTGLVTLDVGGKVAFPRLPETAGLYRFTLTGGHHESRPRVYIGESDNLRRRANGYRNPGPSQLTNLRLNAVLRAHLAAGGVARLAVSSEAELILPGVGHPLQLDLSRKAGRLLAESAGLVLA